MVKAVSPVGTGKHKPPGTKATALKTPIKKKVQSAETSSASNKLSTSARKGAAASKGAAKSPPNSAGRKKRITAVGSRYDSSLGLLTRKFLKLLRTAPEGSLDLNSTANDLGVQKRRIYDITNVLEGIGLLEKKSKNTIMWKGVGSKESPELEVMVSELKKELQALKEEDAQLDKDILLVTKELNEAAEDTTNQSLGYVTSEDLRQLPSFLNNRVFAIRAPSGTSLEVPDPDEGMEEGRRRYHIFLKSPNGSIDVFLVSNDSQHDGKDGGRLSPRMGHPLPPQPRQAQPPPAPPIKDEAASLNNIGSPAAEPHPIDGMELPSPMFVDGISPQFHSPLFNSPTFSLGMTTPGSATAALLKLSPLPVRHDFTFTLDEDGPSLTQFFLNDGEPTPSPSRGL